MYGLEPAGCLQNKQRPFDKGTGAGALGFGGNFGPLSIIISQRDVFYSFIYQILMTPLMIDSSEIQYLTVQGGIVV